MCTTQKAAAISHNNFVIRCVCVCVHYSCRKITHGDKLYAMPSANQLLGSKAIIWISTLYVYVYWFSIVERAISYFTVFKTYTTDQFNGANFYCIANRTIVQIGWVNHNACTYLLYVGLHEIYTHTYSIPPQNSYHGDDFIHSLSVSLFLSLALWFCFKFFIVSFSMVMSVWVNCSALHTHMKIDYMFGIVRRSHMPPSQLNM